MVVLDEVDYDETILTFDDEDVLAEVVDGVPGPVAGVGGPGDARVLPEGPGFGSRYLTGGAGTPRRPSRSGCPGRGRRQRCGAPGGPFARRAPRRLTRNRPGSSRFAWHSGGREGSSGGGGDRGGDGHDPLPSRPCRSAARAPPRTWLPKGKRLPGERRRAAAARETLEETGRAVEVGDRVADVGYRDRLGRSKQVRYYQAVARSNRGFVPSAEVDRARWVPVAAAVRKVPARDRRVLEAAAA